jgi:hypothetical protein
MNHISIRLPWHDRGWDGCICDKPMQNVYCKGFHSVNAEHIRKNKRDDIEKDSHGEMPTDELGYYPPCTETINVFGSKSIIHTHYPKSFIRDTSPKSVTIPPGASGTWPFEDMWDEAGNRKEPDERKAEVEQFFDEIKQAGTAGLIFYYCNYDNPVSGNEKKYLLAGIARIKKVNAFIKWDDIPQKQAELYGDIVWTRIVENDPEERIRLPYQEYISMGKNPNDIAVFAEGSLSRSFKYVAHHISDDNAIILIDRTIVAVKKLLFQSYLDKNIIQDWEKKLEWLKSIRKECWINRGLYPGLSSVLKFLGMKKPDEFVRIRLKNIPASELKNYFFDRFEDKIKLSTEEESLLTKAKDRYLAMLKDPYEEIKAKLCRDKLPFFDFDEEQVKNILHDNREDYSITSSLVSIYENPYIISEEYVGIDVDDFVSFDKIDHGMIPSEELENAERIDFDDPIRLRALMHSFLLEAAKDGHSFLDWDVFSEKVNKWHKDNDKSGIFNFDRTAWNQHKQIFSDKLIEDVEEGIHAVYLKRLHDAERILRQKFVSLIKDDEIPSAGLNWQAILEVNGTSPIPEQINALEKLYKSRLGVLTGTAGTGKTTVIRALVQGIKKVEPNHNFLLLAPTGKASLILTHRIKDDSVRAVTIHSFLMSKKWINKKNYTLKTSGETCQTSTLIIDECSMIELLLFATAFRAIDIGNIERVVLVGDYNQLPPIGPGKIFFDLIQYLRKVDERFQKCLAELNVNWRQKQGSKASLLANHFAKVKEMPDENIFAEIEAGYFDLSNNCNGTDLFIEKWLDEEDLIKKIPKVIEFAVDKLLKKDSGTLAEKYDKAHGIPFGKSKNVEAITLIAPYRHMPTGVDNLNLAIQKVLKGKETVDKFNKFGYVFCDKVLQIKNHTYWTYDHNAEETIKTDENYIPNGTLGYVFPKKSDKLQVKFPKDYIKYSYYLTKKLVNENIELGYAISVHKSQGSQFDITILVVPAEDSDFLNREMLYTAMTRSTKMQIIMIQKDLSILKSRLWLGKSEIMKRNSSLFQTAKGIPSKGFDKYMPENLVYEALPDTFVRSRDEMIISQSLAAKGIGFNYEKILISKDAKTFKIPDFTFKHKRKEYYWEHYGMLDDAEYSQKVEKKRKWYKENGYQNQLIETPIEGMNLDASINYVFQNMLDC